MGESTEQYNARLGISREDQDEFSARSHELAAAAMKKGRFEEEIVPVEIPPRKGDPLVVREDEGVRPGTTAASLARLRPAFAPDGTITAGSASQISTGAAAVVVMSRPRREELGAPILAEVGAHGVAAGPDASLQAQPANAIQAALDRECLTPGSRPRRDQRGVRLGRDPLHPPARGGPDLINVNGGAIVWVTRSACPAPGSR